MIFPSHKRSFTKDPFEKDKPESWKSAFFTVFLVLFLFINMISFVLGAIDGNAWYSRRESCRMRGKWAYVLPAYYAGCKASRWMSEEDE